MFARLGPIRRKNRENPVDESFRTHLMSESRHDPRHAEPAPQTGGWLALVSTPIGNLEDITLRALRVLREADLIAAEDTRRARRLCQRYDIDTPLTSYHAHNEHRRTAALLDQVQAGKRIAVLSDAGTPVISDPGFLIVREALRRGIEPMIVPGVSALTWAVVAAGLPMDRFCFLGFLPSKGERRRKRLLEMREHPGAYILFESPHRMSRLLQEMREVLGGDVRVAVCREATKLHEECIRGNLDAVFEQHGNRTWKGEITVVVCTRPERGRPEGTAATTSNS